VQGKKKRDAEAADARKRLEAVTVQKEVVSESPPVVASGGDLLRDKDEDIIF
jgi:hypothetical protein